MEEKKYLKWYNKIGYGSGDIAGNVVNYNSRPQKRYNKKEQFKTFRRTKWLRSKS